MEMPTLRTQIKIILILLLWSVFGYGYFGRFPLPDFWVDLLLLAVAGVVVSSATGYGSIGMKPFLSKDLTGAEYYCFSTILGFGILSLFMMLAGIFGFWT